MASRHGPSPVSYWMASTRMETSPVAPAVRGRPWFGTVMAHSSQPSMTPTAVSATRPNSSSDCSGVAKERAMDAKASASP